MHSVSLADPQTRTPHGQSLNTLVAGTTFEFNGRRVKVSSDQPIDRKKLKPSANRLAVSLDYMMAHLDQPMRISSLCAQVGLSPSRFFELFKNATGDTPLNWFIRARMRRAGELLEKSDLQIKEVAGQVGYNDPFYFSRLFKVVHGMSPTAYRKQKGSPKKPSERPNISSST